MNGTTHYAGPDDGKTAEATPVANLCGCGKAKGHKGMCSYLWAIRKEKYGPSGGIRKQVIPPIVAAVHAFPGTRRSDVALDAATDAPATTVDKPFDFGAELLAIKQKMMIYAFSLTRDRDQAEDLYQRLVVRVLEMQDKFEIGTNFSGWCSTVMRNLFISDTRTGAARSRTTSLDQTHDNGSQIEINDVALHQAPMQESGIAVREMVQGLKTLRPEDREALLRAGIEGQSYAEISAATGVSDGTVKSRIHRARERLDPERKEARVIAAVSAENADAYDFVLQKLRQEKQRIEGAIAMLEQCRGIFAKVR